MLRIILLLSLSAGMWAQDSIYLVSLKATSAIGFFTPEGRSLAVVPVGKNPHEFTLSSDGRFLYATDNGVMVIEDQGQGGNTISIVDIAARKKVGEISLGKFRRPHGITLDRGTGLLYVTTELPDQLLVVDPKSRKVLRNYETKGRTAHWVTLGPGSRYAYVSNDGSHNVSAIELKTGAVTLIPVGRRPEGSALSPDGRELYVANRDSDFISVIDIGKNTVVGEIPMGKGAVRIATAPDGRVVWANFHENRIEIADPGTRKVISRFDLPDHVVSLTLSRDGSLAFTSAQAIDTVFVSSLTDSRVIRSIKTGAGSGPDPIMEIPAK